MPGEPDRLPVSRRDGARRRVLDAALRVLSEQGLPGFTMEAIARAAGAGKTTLYRRWSTPAELLTDAMDSTFRPVLPPDTGSLDGDVRRLADGYAALLSSEQFPRLLATFIDAAERDPELAARHRELTRLRREPLVAILQRAVATGELVADFDAEQISEFIAAPLFYRRFVARAPITPEYIDDVIRRVLDPLRLPARPNAGAAE
jgi:AcrR family transcriptional regulator